MQLLLYTAVRTYYSFFLSPWFDLEHDSVRTYVVYKEEEEYDWWRRIAFIPPIHMST